MSNKKVCKNCPDDLLNAPVEIRLAKAKDLDSSPEILKLLAKDKFWYVRDYVAANIKTPKESLELLCNDTDFRVRIEARRTLIRHAAEVGHEDFSLNDIVLNAESIKSVLQNEKDTASTSLTREDVDL